MYVDFAILVRNTALSRLALSIEPEVDLCNGLVGSIFRALNLSESSIIRFCNHGKK